MNLPRLAPVIGNNSAVEMNKYSTEQGDSLAVIIGGQTGEESGIEFKKTILFIIMEYLKSGND